MKKLLIWETFEFVLIIFDVHECAFDRFSWASLDFPRCITLLPWLEVFGHASPLVTPGNAMLALEGKFARRK